MLGEFLELCRNAGEWFAAEKETKLILQKEELETVEWFDLEETYVSCKNHAPKFCTPTGGMEVIMRELRGEYKA